MNNTFSVRAVLSKGWSAYAAHWGFLTIASAAVLAISIAVDFVVNRSANFSSILYAVLLVVGLLVNLIIQIGLVRATLLLIDGKPADFRELVTNSHYFLPYAVSTIMLAAILLVGFTLVIVPGVIAMLVLGYAPILVLDEDLGPVDSLKRSAKLTKGARLRILALYAIVMAMIIASVLAFGIGLIVTIPLSMMISAAALRALQARERSLPEADESVTEAVVPAAVAAPATDIEAPAVETPVSETDNKTTSSTDPSDPSNGAYA
jgi:hypothetical protein